MYHPNRYQLLRISSSNQYLVENKSHMSIVKLPSFTSFFQQCRALLLFLAIKPISQHPLFLVFQPPLVIHGANPLPHLLGNARPLTKRPLWRPHQRGHWRSVFFFFGQIVLANIGNTINLFFFLSSSHIQVEASLELLRPLSSGQALLKLCS